MSSEESVGAALADVAHVDVLEEGVGNPVMADEPEEVRQEDEERESDASPEPAGGKVAARGGEGESGENAGDVEDDGVFCVEAETKRSADRKQPARIFRLEQTDDEVSDEHPPEKIERGVLKFVAFEDLRRGKARRRERL